MKALFLLLLSGTGTTNQELIITHVRNLCAQSSIQLTQTTQRLEKLYSTLNKDREEALLRGSQDAAMRLLSALTSEFKNNELDPKVIEFWLSIAAENGSPNAQHAYAQILWKASSKNPLLRLRARFWANRSAEQGFQPAKTLLLIFDKSEKR
jgi:TPR repeat protein